MAGAAITEQTSSFQRLGRALAILLVAVLGAGIIARSGIGANLLRRAVNRHKRVLRVWDWWSPATDEKYAGYFDAVKRDFQRLHPDVDVVYQFVPFGQYEQKMATALAGASPADVFQSSVVWAEGFYDRGMLLPLNGYLARDAAQREYRRAHGQPVDPGDMVDRSAYLESAWRHNTKPDGTVFGIPQILDASCLVWNLDILRKAAAKDPEIRGMFQTRPDGSPDHDHLRFDAVRDWDQFRRITRKLTIYDTSGQVAQDDHGNPIQSGFAIHAHGAGAGPFIPWLASDGGRFQDSAGTRALFAGPEGVETMQFLLDLYWKDHVSPPFRRQLSDEEVFDQGRIACAVNGTWSGKYITRDTDNRLRFDFTPFPPGPHGHGPATVAWGNMLAISSRCPQPDLAWDYVRLVCGLQGSLRLLKHIQQNSPRKDFYQSPAWSAMVGTHPYLHNVPAICACGQKLRHTQINAVGYVSDPIFESLLLSYPEIAAGRGPYPSVPAALVRAAGAVDRVYARYNAQVLEWRTVRR